MTIQRIVVCEAQVPFVRGGAEYLVRALVDAAARARLRAELVSFPFKWYPNGGTAGACGGLAADRPEREQRPVDRSGDRVEVPDLLRPASATRSPGSCTSTARRTSCAARATASSRTPRRRRPARDADAARRRDAGECRRRVHQLAQHRRPAREVQRPRGAKPCTRRRRSPVASRPGPYGDYVLFVGRLESVKRPDLAVRAMCHVDRPIRLVVVGDGTSGTRTEALAESLGLSDRIEFLGCGRGTSDLIDLYKDALAVALRAVRRGLRIRDARGVSRARSRSITDDRCGRTARVRRGRRERLRLRAGARGHRRRPSIGSPAIASSAASLGRAGFERARSITWDGVIARSSSHDEATKLIIQIPCLNEAETLPATLARPSAKHSRHRHRRGARHRRWVD